MRSLLPFDELNTLKAKLSTATDFNGKVRYNYYREDILDDILDLLLLAYYQGTAAVNEQLKTDVRPSVKEAEKVIYKKIDGKDWKQRVEEYLTDEGTADEIFRVAETETHRVYNESGYTAALSGGKATGKRWLTMLDDKVRDSHKFLEGEFVPLDAKFYTYDDSAYFPGGFSKAENNCGCRCEIEYQ